MASKQVIVIRDQILRQIAMPLNAKDKHIQAAVMEMRRLVAIERRISRAEALANRFVKKHPTVTIASITEALNKQRTELQKKVLRQIKSPPALKQLPSLSPQAVLHKRSIALRENCCFVPRARGPQHWIPLHGGRGPNTVLDWQDDGFVECGWVRASDGYYVQSTNSAIAQIVRAGRGLYSDDLSLEWNVEDDTSWWDEIWGESPTYYSVRVMLRYDLPAPKRDTRAYFSGIATIDMPYFVSSEESAVEFDMRFWICDRDHRPDFGELFPHVWPGEGYADTNNYDKGTLVGRWTKDKEIYLRIYTDTDPNIQYIPAGGRKCVWIALNSEIWVQDGTGGVFSLAPNPNWRSLRDPIFIMVPGIVHITSESTGNHPRYGIWGPGIFVEYYPGYYYG